MAESWIASCTIVAKPRARANQPRLLAEVATRRVRLPLNRIRRTAMPSENPYQSPESEVVGTSPRDGSRLAARGWLYRKVELDAPINATIEYNGRCFGHCVASSYRSRARKSTWKAADRDAVVGPKNEKRRDRECKDFRIAFRGFAPTATALDPSGAEIDEVRSRLSRHPNEVKWMHGGKRISPARPACPWPLLRTRCAETRKVTSS